MAERKKKGFALLSPEERRSRARQGGLSVPAEKRAFYQDRDLAAEASAKSHESRKKTE